MFLHVGVDLYLFSQHSLQSQNIAESGFLSYKKKPLKSSCQVWLCNTEGNAGWSLQRKFILVVRPNDRSKTNCDVAIQLYDPEDIWQLCCSLRIVWFSVSYADLFVWTLWKLLKNACDLWREWHNPMTKDKIQDQKFIIYKAIRYLMSDISMQYHTEMNSVYYDQHFKLCTDRFFI